MKYILLGTLMVVIGGVGFAFTLRDLLTPTNTTEVVVLRDVTDTFNARPDAHELLKLFDYKDDPWNGAKLLYSNVSDVTLNNVHQVSLNEANKWLSNELDRDKKINQFQAQVINVVDGAAKDTVGRNHSSVYLAIALQLKHVAESKSEKKVLVVYSDLMENEPGLSFYNPNVFSLIQSKPDTVMKVLEAKFALPSLNGINVYLINQPTDVTNDQQFRIVSGLYKKLLENKGATVHISATLMY